jgi:O-antigen/teichoic acid export membrane protein
MAVANMVNIVWLYNDNFIMSIARYPDLASYALPHNMNYALTFFPIALSMAFFPALSRDGDMTGFVGKCTRYTVLLMLPVVVLTIILAGPITTFVAGPGFEDAALPLAIVAVAVVPMSGCLIFASAFNATGLERANMRGTMLFTIVSIIGDVLLIPPYGAVGAGAVLVASMLGMAVYCAIVAWRAQGVNMARMLLALWPSLAATIVMAPAVWYAPINLYGSVFTGFAVYAFMLVALGGVSEEEQSLFIGLARRALNRSR